MELILNVLRLNKMNKMLNAVKKYYNTFYMYVNIRLQIFICLSVKYLIILAIILNQDILYLFTSYDIKHDSSTDGKEQSHKSYKICIARCYICGEICCYYMFID